MFEIKQKGGNLLVAYSESFENLIRDIAGRDGQRGLARKIKMSSSYGKNIMDGYVPSEDVLARIVQAYNLDEKLTKQLFDTARQTRPEMNTELLIQTACTAEGLSTSDRLAVLALFRELAERQRSGGQQAA